jgi:hypothetical protein
MVQPMTLTDSEVVALVKMIGATNFDAIVLVSQKLLTTYPNPNKRHAVFVEKLLTMSALHTQYIQDRQSLSPDELARKWS